MTAENLKELLEASNYRRFMAVWIEIKSESKKMTYSDIARWGGFSSRSFPRDVLKGSKRLTLISLPKMIRGLQLPVSLGSYFRLLVEAEHEDCRPLSGTTDSVTKNLAKHKERLLSQSTLQDASVDTAFSISHIPEVYAALGSAETGSHVDDIIARTGLSEGLVLISLEKMLELKMVNKKKFRYYPTQNHISLEGLKKSQLFKHHFRKCCDKASDVARQKFDSDEHLFLSSAFSVNKKDLPKLKEDLRTLLLSYIDTSEKPNGNAVVNLVAGLF